MGDFSRRGFFGTILGALAVWWAGDNAARAAAPLPPPLPAPELPAAHPSPYGNSPESVTTHTYDATSLKNGGPGSGATYTYCAKDSGGCWGEVTTYTYDAHGRLTRIEGPRRGEDSPGVLPNA